VRQALGLLSSYGVVESRVGSGTFVVGTPDGAEGQGLGDGEEAREIMEARLVVEVAAARLAAQRSPRSDEQLELLSAIVEALERAVDRETFPTEIDLAFHRAVVQLTANSYLVALTAPLWPAIGSVLVPTLSQRRWTAVDTARVAGEHRAVYEALRVGDPGLSGFAMERHLRSELAKLVDGATVDGPPPRFFA
jgi:GntR family transcriptional repressor for pyruvate dehydrogenase complex